MTNLNTLKLFGVFLTIIIGIVIFIALTNTKAAFTLPPEVRAEYNDLSERYSELDIEKLELKRIILENQVSLELIENEIQLIAEDKQIIEDDYLSLVPIAEARHIGKRDRIDLSLPVHIVQNKLAPIIQDDKERSKLRIKDYLDTHAHSSLHGTEDIWIELGEKHKIKPEVSICIAWADTRLGKAMATSFNYGNWGNNDRGNRVHLSSKYEGISKIFEALNNQYLGHKQAVGSLSQGGGGNTPWYASSKFNWNNNVLTCLREMHDDTSINESYEIRIKE